MVTSVHSVFGETRQWTTAITRNTFGTHLAWWCDRILRFIQYSVRCGNETFAWVVWLVLRFIRHSVICGNENMPSQEKTHGRMVWSSVHSVFGETWQWKNAITRKNSFAWVVWLLVLRFIRYSVIWSNEKHAITREVHLAGWGEWYFGLFGLFCLFCIRWETVLTKCHHKKKNMSVHSVFGEMR